MYVRYSILFNILLNQLTISLFHLWGRGAAVVTTVASQCLHECSLGTRASSHSPKIRAGGPVGHKTHPVRLRQVWAASETAHESKQQQTFVIWLLMLSSARVPEVTQSAPLPTHTAHTLVTGKSDNGVERGSCD